MFGLNMAEHKPTLVDITRSFDEFGANSAEIAQGVVNSAQGYRFRPNLAEVVPDLAETDPLLAPERERCVSLLGGSS